MIKKIFFSTLAMSLVSAASYAASYSSEEVAQAAMGSDSSVLTASPTTAGDCASFSHKNGFYVGAGLGALNMSSTWNNTAGTDFSFGNAHDYGVNFQNTLTVDAGNIGWDMTGFAGYAWYLPKNTFLALELFDNKLNTSAGGNDTPSTEITIDSQTATLQRNFNISMTLENVWGARLLPGYQLSNDVLVYGILGWAQARANTDASYELVLHDVESRVVYPGASDSGSYNFNGYQLGFGSMINLTEHLALRGDLIYTAYNDKTLNQGVDVDPDGSTNTLQVTSELTTFEANLSLVYLFD